MGTTASIPVYDRSKSPPTFLGVIGVDFLVTAMQDAIGGQGSYESVLQKLTNKAASCPNTEINRCTLEALRKMSGSVDGSDGNEARCGGCSDEYLSQILPEPCGSTNDYPTEFWHNSLDEGSPYTEKTCCNPGTPSPADSTSDQCVTADDMGMIIGIVVVAAFVLTMCLCRMKSKNSGKIEAIQIMRPEESSQRAPPSLNVDAQRQQQQQQQQQLQQQQMQQQQQLQQQQRNSIQMNQQQFVNQQQQQMMMQPSAPPANQGNVPLAPVAVPLAPVSQRQTQWG